MTERIVGRPWTDEEDRLLTQAVTNNGEHDNWKTIAHSVPGRTNKACRKRWLHSLSPTVKKTAWTPDEDQRLLEFYHAYGPKWSTIAREIPGRTDDACSKRYREALDPNLKKDEWSPEEDARLMEVYSQIGGKWGQVGQELKRSGLGCRNRWRLLQRKKAPKPVTEPDLSQIFNFHELPPSQPELSQIDWSPYYPLETYPSFLPDETPQIDQGFQLPTPQELSPISSHIEIPPFQFSSSSLSAALSDPPRIPRPLPSVSAVDDTQAHDQHASPPASASPSPPRNGVYDNPTDNVMLLDDFLNSHEDYERIPSRTAAFYYDDGSMAHDLQQYHSQPLPMSNSPSGLPSTELAVPDCSWKPSFTSLSALIPRYEQRFPQYDDTAAENSVHDDFSSAGSTPFGLNSSLSPTTTPPDASSHVELPVNELAIGDSLLFSSHNRRAPSRNSRKLASKKSAGSQGPTRLSSMLPLTSDPSVKPYACGRELCWPPEAPSGRVCFATSKELFDHSKAEHADEPMGDRPFRCALAGCGKSWKNLNGLQYHLQISTAHFRNALSSSFSAQTSTEGEPPSSPARTNHEAEASDEAKRTYLCRFPHCFKAYRQLSGLRYHHKHGHPQDMPVQLEVVPPTLARQISVKTKKMRRKCSLEPEP